jgi:hypothetical protein
MSESHTPTRRTQLNGFLQTSAYRDRTRARDPCCLISSLPVVRGDFSRFKAAHIFPRAHDVDVRPSCPFHSHMLTMNIQWVNKRYPSRITDPATLPELGGPTKIDSIQNVLLLRSDLHDAWDNYKFAVNPDVCMFCPYLVSVLTIRSDSAGMWSFRSFPGTMILLERSSNSITSPTTMCGPLMSFSVTIFFKVC